jgi:DNA-binding MarR family transcriptional regulator
MSNQTGKMTLLIAVEKRSRNVLETAIRINDPLKNIYITLYCFGELIAPKEIAKKLRHARAYFHMLLRQLESMC